MTGPSRACAKKQTGRSEPSSERASAGTQAAVELAPGQQATERPLLPRCTIRPNTRVRDNGEPCGKQDQPTRA